MTATLPPAQRAEILRREESKHGWSKRTEARVAELCRCTTRTVRRDRRTRQDSAPTPSVAPDREHANQSLDDEPEDDGTYRWAPERERRRVRRLLRVEADMERARTASAWATVATLHKQCAQLEGLAVPPPEPVPERSEEEIAGDDDLRSTLAEIVDAIREARSRGAMVPLQGLIRQKMSIQEAIRAEDEERAAAAAAETSDMDLLAMLSGRLEELPELIVERIRGACDARLEGEVEEDSDDG